jgi:hypothetical protein
MYTGGVSSGGGNLTEGEQKKADAKTVLSQMKSKAGADGFISPQDWIIAKRRWQVVYPDDDFDTRFSIMKNPNNQDYE